MTVKKQFKIIGMNCTSCVINIDGELEDTGKIQKVKTNYAKQLTEVTFDSEECTEDEIISAIKRAGFDAQPVKS